MILFFLSGFFFPYYYTVFREPASLRTCVFPLQIAECSVILNFDVSPTTMTQRLLHRAQTSGRVDDNEETIKKRLDTFTKHSKPVIEHFCDKCKTVSKRKPGHRSKVLCLRTVDLAAQLCFFNVCDFLTVSIPRKLPFPFTISLIQRDTVAEPKDFASRTTILKSCYQH